MTQAMIWLGQNALVSTARWFKAQWFDLPRRWHLSWDLTVKKHQVIWWKRKRIWGKRNSRFRGGKEHIFEKLPEASVSGEKCGKDRVRVDEVGETQGPSSCREWMKLKFSSKCYMKPLKGLKKKNNKMHHSVSVPNVWHITGAQKLDEWAKINAYQVLFKQWRVSELTVIIIWRRIRHYPQTYSLRSQSDYRLLGKEGGNPETPGFYSS